MGRGPVPEDSSMLGRHHPLLRRVRALRRDAALRRSEGLFLAEGIHLAQEALSSAARIEAVFFSARLRQFAEGPELLARIRARDLACHEVDAAALDAAQDARSAQPILCLVRHEPLGQPEAAGLLDHASLAVVLEGVQDPGNLGSILRSADGAGCDVGLVGDGSADPFHPRAVRATMGSVFRVALLRESSAVALERLRRHGFRLVGADPHRGTDYDRADLQGKLAFVFGGEAAGLTDPVRERLDDLLRIPLRSGVESLSVAAAAAVLLFEAARQRRR